MNHFQRYLVDEFVEDYSEGRLSRRQALKLIASVTGSLAMASGLLAACAPPAEETPTAAPPPSDAPPAGGAATPAPTQAATQPPAPTAAPQATEAPTQAAAPTQGPVALGTVMPDDPAIQAGPVTFPGVDAELMGYLARPAGEGPFPIVLVCHENRGLTAHIEDVARRVARNGFVGLAVDLLSRQGGTAAVGSDAVPGALSGMTPEQYGQDFRSGWDFVRGQAYAQGDLVGMTGFCFGGGVTWQVATAMPELKAAVPYYGPHPLPEDVPGINAAVLAIYGELDQRINQGIPAIEAAMQQAGKVYAKQIYPNADHAFHNDTGSRYNAEAAQDAWTRTIEWFRQYLVA